MSITIIGCGWLGLPLGKTLAMTHDQIFGSVRSKERFNELKQVGITPFQLDLEHAAHVPTEITDQTSLLIISIPPLFRKTPEVYQERLTQLINQFSAETRIVFTSSTGIYPKSSGNFDENFIFNSEQESSVLNVAENTIRSSQRPYLILRLGGLIGPNRHPIRFLQSRKEVKNPHGSINFVHQKDCIRAILQASENTELSGTFNLVYPSHPRRKNYYTKAAEHYNLEAPSFKEEEAISRIISSKKIQRDFPFEFDSPIDNFPQLNIP